MRIYENVTRAIIEEMERGAVPWVRPWKTDRHNIGSVMPANAITGRSYSGINVPILWASADSNGYPSHAWMTFKQALDHGAHVRKGERGTHVVFTKPLVFKGEDDEIEKRSMLREYTVFNVAQIDGLHRRRNAASARARAACARSTPSSRRRTPTIRHGGDKACFVPALDLVNMPPASSFKSIERILRRQRFTSLGHWSGHKPRLDRDLPDASARGHTPPKSWSRNSQPRFCARISA